MTRKPTECQAVIITGDSGTAIVRTPEGTTLALPIVTVPGFWDKMKEKANGQKR